MAQGIGNFIDRIQLGTDEANQIAIGSSAYAVCSTAAATAKKQITIKGFTLNTGTTIHIKFTHNNSADSPTLEITNPLNNMTYEKPIVQYGTTAVEKINSTTGWQAGAVITLTYDGTSWVRDQGYNTNTTYSTITQNEAWTGTATTARSISAANLKSILSNLDGSGLTLTYNATNGIILNHTNSITAKTNYASTATTVSANGGSIVLTDIKYDAQGHITASTDRTITLSLPSTMTPSAHTHGNISNTGTIGQTENWSIDNGDELVVADKSNSWKLERSGIAFDGTTTTQALTKAGTWATFNNYSHPTGNGNKHIPKDGASGNFLKYSSAGTAAWANVTWSDIQNIPSTFAPAAHDHDYVKSIENLTGNLTLSQLGLTKVLRFIGSASSTISEATTTAPTIVGRANYIPEIGDVVLDSNDDAEYVCIDKTTTNDTTSYTWELLGRSGDWASDDHTHGNITNDGKMSGSTVSGDVSTTDKFLREDGIWTVPAYTMNTDSKVSQTASTTSKWRKILLGHKEYSAYNTAITGETDVSYEAVGISAQPSTGSLRIAGSLITGSTITGTAFYGNGANITLGTASVAVVTDANKKLSTENLSVTDSNTSTDATTTFVQAVTQSATGKITVTKAALDTSGNWSGLAATATADASGNTITTTYATKTEMNGLLAAADAMIFKGTIGAGGTINTTADPVGDLPDTHEAGWTYKVITDGTYNIVDSNGKYCEVGTLIICIADGTSADPADWTAVETNEDGSVIGPASSTNAHIVTFDGTSGRIIKDSGFTIETSVPSGAVFTDVNVTATANTATTFYLIGASGSSTATGTMLKSKDIWYTSNNTSGDRKSELVLGNSTSTGSSGGRYGRIRLYGNVATYYLTLSPATGLTANHSLTLPNKDGTLVVGTTSTTTNAIAIYSDTTGTLANSSATISDGTITATTFNGSLIGDVTGNADTATEWADAQNVKVILGTQYGNGTGQSETAINGGQTAVQTIAVDGILKVSNGGTGADSVNAYGVVYGNSSANAYDSISSNAEGQVFIGHGASGSTSAPSWYSGLLLTGAGTVASPYNATFANDVSITGDLTVTATTKLTSNVGIGTDPDNNYLLYVDGETFFNDDATINGDLIPTISSGNAAIQSLGTDTNLWASLFIDGTYGDEYTPIYWDDTNGKPATSIPLQYIEFTISQNNLGVTLTSTAFTANSYVVQIVITNGESNLNSIITWTSSSGSIALTCDAVSGAVEGYILVARGGNIQSTIIATQITPSSST